MSSGETTCWKQECFYSAHKNKIILSLNCKEGFSPQSISSRNSLHFLQRQNQHTLQPSKRLMPHLKTQSTLLSQTLKITDHIVHDLLI